MTDYLIDATAYTEGQVIPSGSTVNGTLVQINKGAGQITALAAAASDGTRGIRIVSAAAAVCLVQYGPSPEGADPADSSVAWVELAIGATPPAADLSLLTIRAGTGSAQMAELALTTAGRVAVKLRAGNVHSTFPTVLTNTPGVYRFVLGAVRGTAGTAPVATNGHLNVAVYRKGNPTPVDTPLAVTNVDTGQAQARYARFGVLTAMAAATTVNMDRVAGYRTGSAALVPPTNAAPTAGIAASQTADVEAGQKITLTLTEGDDVAVTGRTFRQVSGPTAVVTGTGLTRTVEAPTTLAGGACVFGYRTTDAQGAQSAEATVSIEVLPAPERVLYTYQGTTAWRAMRSILIQ